LRTEGREELTAEERLAGPNLAGDLDEALAIRCRDQQRVERRLGTAAGEEITGVRSDAERQLTQAEVL
jgi:hypothetical protein